MDMQYKVGKASKRTWMGRPILMVQAHSSRIGLSSYNFWLVFQTLNTTHRITGWLKISTSSLLAYIYIYFFFFTDWMYYVFDWKMTGGWILHFYFNSFRAAFGRSGVKRVKQAIIVLVIQIWCLYEYEALHLMLLFPFVWFYLLYQRRLDK